MHGFGVTSVIDPWAFQQSHRSGLPPVRDSVTLDIWNSHGTVSEHENFPAVSSLCVPTMSLKRWSW